MLGLIGNGISYSLSPTIHNTWLKTMGASFQYELFDLDPKTLKPFLDKVHNACFNVTIPYKTILFEWVQIKDDLCEFSGAVNTITIENGISYGTNTDVMAIIDLLKDVKDITNVAIFGAGGGAKGAICALRRLGVFNIHVFNKTARFISGLNSLPYESFRNIACSFDVIINATPKESLEIDRLDFFPHQIVFDMVYRPFWTDILKKARKSGAKTVHGIDMLLHQAAHSFDFWFGVKPDVAQARDNVGDGNYLS